MPQRKLCTAQIVVGLGVTGLEVNCAAAACGRLIESPEIQQCVTQVIVRLGEVRTEEQGAPIGGESIVEPPKPREFVG
jgi:hypothetical protein